MSGVPKFNARIGRATLGSSVRPSEAAFTQSSRDAMQAIIREYQAWVEYLDLRAPDILMEALEPTLELAKSYTPYHTGALRDSGYLESSYSRGRSQVEIGFGRGGSPDYTAYVHENLDMQHASPTSAKFLEKALEEDWVNVTERILEGLKEVSGV